MMLMEEAERIARDEHGAAKLAVISGIECIPSLFLSSSSEIILAE